jgi:hypothetical protein
LKLIQSPEGKQAGHHHQNVLTVKSLGYPSSSELFKTARGLALAKTLLVFYNRMDINNVSLKGLNKVPTDLTPYVTEHIVEVDYLDRWRDQPDYGQLQTVKMFLEYVIDRSPPRLSSVADSAFFQTHWSAKLSKAQVAKRTHKPLIEMGQSQSLNDLVFEAPGSSSNRKDFVLFEKQLTSYKERLWSDRDPMASNVFETLLDAALAGGLPSNYSLGSTTICE